MHKKILGLLAFFTVLFLHISATELTYTIKLLDSQKFEVQLRFSANQSGITNIILPVSWTGDLFSEITDIQCVNGTIVDTETLEIKEIHHNQTEELLIRYRVTPTVNNETEWHLPSIAIAHDQIYFTGDSFFIVPDVNLEEISHITLEWLDLPSDWAILNSFAAQNSSQKLEVSLASLKHGVFIAGGYKIARAGTEDNAPYVAMKGDWSFSDDKFLRLLGNIINEQRRFWNDTDFPHYMITLLPNGGDSFDKHFIQALKQSSMPSPSAPMTFPIVTKPHGRNLPGFSATSIFIRGTPSR